MTTVTVRVPAKVNLQLAVGPPRADGFHGLVNVFHAVSLYDEVTVTTDLGAEPHAQRRPLVTLSVAGDSAEHAARVPLDGSNLAARAAHLVARRSGASHPVRIHLDKAIPVAGGMAGGSADAAAALVACDALWGAGLGRAALMELGAELGSDVCFPLLGATAVGTGRGERLDPLDCRGRFHWVFALADGGLPTGSVFAEYDRIRPDAPDPALDPALVRALAEGDARALGAALGNDLEPAALSLRPGLRHTLDAGRGAGALGAIVSGSGPTCAFLAADEGAAEKIAAVVAASGACARTVRAHGEVPGAAIVAGH
ncbi:4-(cytidine 5'-diphospho)-2-C-methyl-D-erythritol kinase [Murinocardiopsis flavida]|nr:4-(cytidine 5'-diphospho)-2-C-methyl-D-erythritol kinase [Murinocardiopsis flavida]